ncbi:anion permease [Neomicrococcus lactis]
MTILLIVVIVAVCGYSWLNGFHDASNSVAASVRTRALSPRVAVVLVASFTAVGTMLGALLGTRLIVRAPEFPMYEDGLAVLLCAVLAAALWSLWTWWQKMPASSTQAILAGVLGSLTAANLLGHGSTEDLIPYAFYGILLPLILTPIVSALLAIGATVPVSWLMRHRTDNEASASGRIIQSITTALLALAHGLQDGQRNAATIVVALMVVGQPLVRGGSILWVQILVAACMACGVLFGGWRITHTMSTNLARLTPMIGATSHASSALLLYVGAFALHMPISTTQSVVSAIVGASSVKRRGFVNWKTFNHIVAYWIATPVACSVGAGILFLAISPMLNLIHGRIH